MPNKIHHFYKYLFSSTTYYHAHHLLIINLLLLPTPIYLFFPDNYHSMEKKPIKRFWEIDFLRGIAIVLMIIFHAIYDINYFGRYGFNLHSGLGLYLARAASVTFILLVGISLTLSYSRAKKMQKTNNLFSKYLKRGLKIFSWGLIITLITWIFLRGCFVKFGILHFIGLSIILAYPFLKLRYFNLTAGIIFICIGNYFKNMTFDFSWLMWMGLLPQHMCTVDYFTIFPWFGLILIGIFLGNSFYSSYIRKFKIPDISNKYFIKLFCVLGRNSLLIYLIHQPILIAILYHGTKAIQLCGVIY